MTPLWLLAVGWLCVCTAALDEELTSQSSPSLQISLSEWDNVKRNVEFEWVSGGRHQRLTDWKYAFSFPLRTVCNKKPVNKQKSSRQKSSLMNSDNVTLLFLGNKHEIRVKKLVWEWLSRKLWASFNIWIFSHIRYWNGKTKSVSDVSKLQCRCVNRRGQ